MSVLHVNTLMVMHMRATQAELATVEKCLMGTVCEHIILRGAHLGTGSGQLAVPKGPLEGSDTVLDLDIDYMVP